MSWASSMRKNSPICPRRSSDNMVTAYGKKWDVSNLCADTVGEHHSERRATAPPVMLQANAESCKSTSEEVCDDAARLSLYPQIVSELVVPEAAPAFEGGYQIECTEDPNGASMASIVFDPNGASMASIVFDPNGESIASLSFLDLEEINEAPSRHQVEVSPGELVPLRGATETKHAISCGATVILSCSTCDISLHCIEDADMAVCPDCRTLTPLVVKRTDMSLQEAMTSFKHGVGGVGLGVKIDETDCYMPRLPLQDRKQAHVRVTNEAA